MTSGAATDKEALDAHLHEHRCGRLGSGGFINCPTAMELWHRLSFDDREWYGGPTGPATKPLTTTSATDKSHAATHFELFARGLPGKPDIQIGTYERFGPAFEALLGRDEVEGLRVNIFRDGVCAGWIGRSEV